MKIVKLSMLLNLLLAVALLYVIAERKPAVISQQSEAAPPAVRASDIPSRFAIFTADGRRVETI